MLTVGCIFYNDADGLERLIQSCWKNVDLILCIDGPFRDYNKAKLNKLSKQSTDGSRDIVKKYPNTVLADAPYLMEHQKRQVYLDMCKQCNSDFLIIADSDEYFHPDESNWDEFRKERETKCNNGEYIYNLKNYTVIKQLPNLGPIPLDQARLWKNPGQLEYWNNHHYQFAIRGTGKNVVASQTLYSVKLVHDNHLRSDERREDHDKYIKWLEKYEKNKMRSESKLEKKNRLKAVWAGN